jgi:hypothetical protein
LISRAAFLVFAANHQDRLPTRLVHTDIVTPR